MGRREKKGRGKRERQREGEPSDVVKDLKEMKRIG